MNKLFEKVAELEEFRRDRTHLYTLNHEISAAMRGWRQSQKKTLREIAKKTGLSVSYLSDLEHGRKWWSKKLVKKIQGEK